MIRGGVCSHRGTMIHGGVCRDLPTHLLELEGDGAWWPPHVRLYLSSHGKYATSIQYGNSPLSSAVSAA